jgi:hypothetical protein
MSLLLPLITQTTCFRISNPGIDQAQRLSVLLPVQVPWLLRCIILTKWCKPCLLQQAIHRPDSFCKFQKSAHLPVLLQHRQQNGRDHGFWLRAVFFKHILNVCCLLLIGFFSTEKEERHFYANINLPLLLIIGIKMQFVEMKLPLDTGCKNKFNFLTFWSALLEGDSGHSYFKFARLRIKPAISDLFCSSRKNCIFTQTHSHF